MQSFSRNFPGLAERFAVYSFDKLGQGFTDNPASPAGYTFRAVCQHAYDFLRTMDLSDVHVAGHSRGGLVAAWLACEHPELIQTATIVDSSTTAPVSIEAGNDFYENLAAEAPPGPSLESVRVEPAENSHTDEHLTEAFLERKLEIERLDKIQRAQAVMEDVAESQFFPSIASLRDDVMATVRTSGVPVPTLLLWGLDDRSAPIEWGIDLFEEVGAETNEVEMHILNDAGHYSFRDQPKGFNRALTSFSLE